jgi:hypothetical protein
MLYNSISLKKSKMKLLNLREIEEKHGVNPLASYNLHKTFPEFAHFVMHPTTLGYNDKKINKMLAEPEYLVGASFLGDLWQEVKEVANVAAPFVPLLVGLGREECKKRVKKMKGGMHEEIESESEAEEEEHEKKHMEHEIKENKKIKKLKKEVNKITNSMLKSNKRMMRAELVRKIMKERGVKMIEASRIIKKEGLKY